MSRRIGMMYQEGSGLSVPTYEGWSWPCLLFGPFWYLFKGMWGMGLLTMILVPVTVGLVWLVVPALCNRQYREHLASRGYTAALDLDTNDQV